MNFERIAKRIVSLIWNESEVADDWTVELGWALPGARDEDRFARMKKWVRHQKITSLPNGGFEVIATLKDGTTIRGVKTPDRNGTIYRGWWDVYVDGKLVRNIHQGRRPLEDYLDAKLLAGLERYKKEVDRFDWTAHFSDDDREWVGQQRAVERLKDLYSKLNPMEQAMAYDYFRMNADKEVWTDWDNPNEFKGV